MFSSLETVPVSHSQLKHISLADSRPHWSFSLSYGAMGAGPKCEKGSPELSEVEGSLCRGLWRRGITTVEMLMGVLGAAESDFTLLYLHHLQLHFK